MNGRVRYLRDEPMPEPNCRGQTRRALLRVIEAREAEIDRLEQRNSRTLCLLLWSRAVSRALVREILKLQPPPQSGKEQV